MNSRLNFYQNELSKIRTRIYHSKGNGFYVFKNFLSSDELSKLRGFWLNKSVDDRFSSFIRNSDVTTRSPNYMYTKPNEGDRAYCCFLWNEPPCEVSHSLAFEIQLLRNTIEQRPIYNGLNGLHGQYLQYRLCNTVSSGQVVYPHGDFIEMGRSDPAANHAFDPSRLQATLLLSTQGEDYQGEGFVMEDNQGKPITFHGMGAVAGDLIVWRYGNLHQVRNVEVTQEQSGFCRIIYPTFELNPQQLYPEVKAAEEFEFIGTVNGDDIYLKSDGKGTK